MDRISSREMRKKKIFADSNYYFYPMYKLLRELAKLISTASKKNFLKRSETLLHQESLRTPQKGATKTLLHHLLWWERTNISV